MADSCTISLKPIMRDALASTGPVEEQAQPQAVS